ncbi:MAG: O-antigen ligase family protein [Bacteroidetes bacterium]|nr:O-antigen ligase family protein [Bacteroidota bacterium]
MMHFLRRLLKINLKWFFVCAFALLLNGQFLYFGIVQFSGNEPNSSMTGMWFIALMSISVAWGSTKERLELTWIDFFIFLFYIYIVLYYLYNDYDSFLLLQKYLVFGIYAYCTGRLFPRKYLINLMYLTVILGVLSIILSVCVILNIDGSFVNGRFAIPVSKNPIMTGITFSIVCYVCILLFVNLEKNRYSYSHAIIFIIGLFSLIFILLAASKQAFIDLAIALAYLWIKWKPVRRARYIAIGCVSSIVVLYFFLRSGNLHLLQSFQHFFVSQSSKIRIEVMNAGLDAFKENPIFGVGPGVTLWSHNIYIDTAGLLGVVGLLLLVFATIPVMLKIILVKVSYHQKKCTEYLFVYGVMLMFFFTSIVSGVLFSSFSFFLCLGLVVKIVPGLKRMKVFTYNIKLKPERLISEKY